MQRAKNKIMDRLEKSVTDRIEEAGGLRRWKEKILQQLKMNKRYAKKNNP